MRIDGGLHRFCDLIDPVADTRHVASKLLDELDELRDFLLRKQIDLQLELRALFRVTRLSVLCDENRRSHEKGAETDEPLKPLERRRVEGSYAKARREHIEPDPRRTKRQNEIEAMRPTELRGGVLDAALVRADASLGTLT